MDEYKDTGYPDRVLFAGCPEPVRHARTPACPTHLPPAPPDGTVPRPDLASRERDRVEMYLLSADGMRVPQLARHFGRCEATMRRWLCQFEAEELKAVCHKQLGTGPDTVRRQTVRWALNGLLSRKRTWTAAQLAEVLAEEKGLVMKPDTVRKYLHLMGPRTGARSTVCATVRIRCRRRRRGRGWGPSKKPATDSWTSSSSTRPASAPACPPTTPRAGADTGPPFPTRAPRDNA